MFLAAALVLDAWLFGGTRFRDLGVHPFWLLSMVMAAHYGTATGVFAVLLGSLLAFVGNLPPRDPLQNQTEYAVLVLGKPVLWFASAVVLGELRMRQERLKVSAYARAAELTARVDGLESTNAALEATSERLRIAAAGQVQTTVALFQAAKTVETQRADSVFASVEKPIRAVLAPTAYSIYLRAEDHLALVVHVTDGRVAPAAALYGTDSALYQAVVLEGRIVHVASAEGEAALGRDGMLAGPLLDAESRAPIGMLKVEALPLTMLRPDVLRAFSALCEWIGATYRTALRFEEANRSRVISPGSQLFSDAFYQSVTTFLLALAERAHFQVSRLAIAVAHDPQATPEARAGVRAVIEAALAHDLRSTDLAFDYFASQSAFYVILPLTPAATCQTVADRLNEDILRRLHALGIKAQVAISFEALYVPTPDDVKRWHRPLFRVTSPDGLQ